MKKAPRYLIGVPAKPRPPRKSRIERRADELGITVDELKARRQRRKERLATKRGKEGPKQARHKVTKSKDPDNPTLAAIYAEEYSTFDALRSAMIRGGVVEHRVPAFDVIQRAIDDTFTDYALLRQRIERDSGGNIEEAIDHPLYPTMERTREAMVRYSTFALQYDIQRRQLALSEARVGILAATLRNVLTGLGLNHDQIQQVPKLLIKELTQHPQGPRQSKLDEVKAEAIAEILANDSKVTITDDIEIEAEDVA